MQLCIVAFSTRYSRWWNIKIDLPNVSWGRNRNFLFTWTLNKNLQKSTKQFYQLRVMLYVSEKSEDHEWFKLKTSLSWVNFIWIRTFLLSSNTVFMFSIQTASTGPSKINHFLSSVVDDACSLKEFARTPSDHSWETGSKQPYNSPMLMDLGFMIL